MTQQMTHTHSGHGKTNLGYPYLIISLCALYLFYKYVLQIYPSVITEQLMRQFNLSGAGLGYLAGTFYYAYMVTQLIVGVLIDKYGTRYLSSFALLCCSIGILVFSSSNTLLVAAISRALMGFGVAFATVGYMKLAAGWFPPRHYAFVGGLLATAAMAGAVFGQAPLSIAVNLFGWRECLQTIGILGLLLTFAFFAIVRDAPGSIHHTGIIENYRVETKDVLHVLRSKQNWLLTLYSGLAFSPIAIFGGLWGNPFLEQAYHLGRTETASMVSIVFIGLGLGSPIIGIFSDYLISRKNRGLIIFGYQASFLASILDQLACRRSLMIVCTLISCASISMVLYCHPLPVWLLIAALFTFGFALGAFMLVFAIGKELNPPYLTGTVISMINASDAIISGLTEPAIGKILDLNWSGIAHNGLHVFTMPQYHIAMSVLPIYLIIASLMLFWVKKD